MPIMYYSGLFAAFTGAVLVLLPTVFANIKHEKEPISVICRNKILGKLFDIGLITTGSLLLVFAYALNTYWEVEYSAGIILYACSSLAMIMTGIIEYAKRERVHNVFARTYFTFQAVASLLISYAIMQKSTQLGITLFAVSSIYLIGILIILLRRRKQSAFEYWGIFYSIIWVLTFYT